MEITIFESVTTEIALTELEAEGEKYSGLYVDMENAPERKYVKDKAAEVKSLIKKVDAHRIADKKAYGVKVEKEAAQIIERLKTANEPFTLLIDAYTLERKKILDAEKALKQAILDAAEYENDHEMGLLINKTFEYDRLQFITKELEIEKQRVIEREEYATQQVKLAKERQRAFDDTERQNKINEENARLADIEHVRHVNRLILKEMYGHGLPEKESIEFIKTIARKQISLLTINY